MLRGKERKNRYAKLNRGRQRFVYIKLQGKKNNRKDKQRNKCRKNIIGFFKN